MGASASLISLVDNGGKGGTSSIKGLALAIELLENASPPYETKSSSSSFFAKNEFISSRYPNFNTDYYYTSPLLSNNKLAWVRRLRSPSILRTAFCEELNKDELISNKKFYHIQLNPLFSAFHIRTLSKTIIRSVLLCYSPVLEEYLKIEDDEDEEEEEEEGEKLNGEARSEPPNSKPVPDLIEPGKKTLLTIIREATITTYRNILERFVYFYCSNQIASKLIKDYYKSVLRKHKRGIRNFELGKKMILTSFRGNFLFYSAVWIFQFQISMFIFTSNLHSSFEKYAFKKQFWVDAKREGMHLGKKAVAHAIKGSLTLVASSTFVGLGSVIRPGHGSWIGFLVGEFIGHTVIPKSVDKFMGLNQF